MKKRILIFIGLFILGTILFRNFIFIKTVPITNYDNTSIPEQYNYDVEGNIYTSNTNDPQMILGKFDTYVDGIKIKLISPASDNINIQLYYSVAGESFNEANSISRIMNKGMTELSLPLKNNTFANLRLDIGDSVGTSFELQSIEVFEKQFDIFQINPKYYSKIFVLFSLCGIASLLLGNLIDRHIQMGSISNHQKKLRESNIELLRILCMLMIIAHHCVVHGGSFSMEYCTNKFIAMILLPGGKIGFTCFLAISTWFLIDTNFKTLRFIRMWFEVFFYSVLFALITLSLSDTLTFKNILGAFLPITGNSHGFASSYLLLYLLLPFLQKITKNMSRIQARFLVLILFYAQVISQIIGHINNYYQSIYSEILLFVLFYFISFNLKKWPVKIANDKLICGLGFVAIWITIIQIQYLDAKASADDIIRFIQAITKDESSLLYILGGYMLFLLVRQIHIPQSRYINGIASVTFGILLIHDHNYFRNILWNDIFQCTQWYYSKYYVLYIIGSVLIIFVICGCFDYLRQYYIEKPLMSWNKLKYFSKRMDDKLNEK